MLESIKNDLVYLLNILEYIGKIDIYRKNIFAIAENGIGAYHQCRIKDRNI
jgi:hypothetical protein